MKKRLLSFVLVLTILLMQFSFLPVTPSVIPGGKSNIQKDNSSPHFALVPNAAYGGVENIKSNRLADPGFEIADVYNGPSEFSPYGTAEITVDSDYTTEVYAGTYGSYMSVKGTPQLSAYASNSYYMLYQSERSYMNQEIDLEFWYNCKANPDMGSNSEINMYLQIMSDVGNVYIYYYFSSNYFPSSNQTLSGFFDLRDSLNTWYQFDRNITQDFIDVFPSLDTSVSYVRQFYMTGYSPNNPTGAVELLFDEVELTNSTAFNYMADNGDFEDGDSIRWTTTNADPGMVFLSDTDYTEGSKSMNITAYSPSTSAYSQASVDLAIYNGWQSGPKGYFTQQTGDLVIEFDWKYSDTVSGGDEFSYFSLSLRNATYSALIFYILGDGSDTLNNFGNSSGATYSNTFIKADDFGVRDTWNHLTIDVYDWLQIFGFTNLAVDYLGFTNYASGPFAKVQLLVDDFHVDSYPANDPSFENNFIWYDYDPILAWMTPYNDDFVNITTDAYSGNYAANLSSHSGYTNVYCRRNMHLPVVNNLYTDFMWRLDEMTAYASDWAYSLITLRLDSSGYTINYVIGKNSAATLSNNSMTCYYTVDGFNQTGLWTNLFRNVSNDVYTAFGIDNWNITQIDLRSYASGSTVATAIFDDLHFVTDNQGPTISNPVLNPTAPEYGETVDVTVDVVDSTEIVQVELIHKIGTGSWVSDIMTPSGDEYSATIPSADYGITVEYYFIAEDIYGNIAQLGSSSSPHSYLVDDTVNPVLAVEAPSSADPVSGMIQFNITEAYDLGSGIALFEIVINLTIVYSGPSVPASYTWDTELFDNINYPVIFRLIDNAGNLAEVGYLYDVYNQTPSPTDTSPFIGGILGITFVIATSFILITYVRRKRKA